MQAMNRQLPVTFESPFVSNPRVTAICKKKKKKKKKTCFLLFVANLTPMRAEVVAIEFAQKCGHHAVDRVELL
jgi:hypothetical protein